MSGFHGPGQCIQPAPVKGGVPRLAPHHHRPQDTRARIVAASPKACRPFLPVRASPSISAAISGHRSAKLEDHPAGPPWPPRLDQYNMLIIIAESRQMRSNECVIRRIRVNSLAPKKMLGAQETIGKKPIGKISLWRDNVCTGIADNGPAPNKAIVHSLYHFDLSYNLFQKTRFFGIMP